MIIGVYRGYQKWQDYQAKQHNENVQKAVQSLICGSRPDEPPRLPAYMEITMKDTLASTTHWILSSLHANRSWTSHSSVTAPVQQ